MVGSITATVGTDWSLVTALSWAAMALRFFTKSTATTVTSTTAIMPVSASPRRETLPVGGGSGDMRNSVTTVRRLRRLAVVAVDDAEDDGNEDQGGDGGEDQAADHGAAE